MSAELRKMVTNSYLTHRESDKRNWNNGHSLQIHGGGCIRTPVICVVEGQLLIHRTKVWKRWGGSQRNPSRWTVLYSVFSLPRISTPLHITFLHMAQAVAVGSQTSPRKRTWLSEFSVVSGTVLVALSWVLTVLRGRLPSNCQTCPEIIMGQGRGAGFSKKDCSISGEKKEVG